MSSAYSCVMQERKAERWVKESAIIVGISLLLGLVAQVAIPLPFTPVPLTLQVPLILFLAAFAGGRRASLAVGLYLLEGAMGLPVFAGGGFGLFHLAGPTGGYLVGFLPASLLVGSLMQQREGQKVFVKLCILLAGNLVILGLGSAWLSCFVGVKSAFYLGVAPFLLGDLVKSLLVLQALRKCA